MSADRLYDFGDGVNRGVDGLPECPIIQANVIVERDIPETTPPHFICYTLKVD